MSMMRGWSGRSRIIKQMNYAGYFLIVWDFIKYARDNGIPVGPGRGSATGSLVAYAMEITNIDPLQNGLLFERFLNPERVSMPDIDVDFCMNRRGEVIDYVTRKYGREQVAQIITFNTMAAKAAIKDCGRALDMPYGDVDRIAKLVPATVGMTLDKALEEVPELRKVVRERRGDQGADRHGEEAGRAGARGGGACVGGGDCAAAADRAGAAGQDQERRNRDRLRHEGGREDGPAEDGLPGADDADGDRRLPEADRARAAGRRWTSRPFRWTTRRPSGRSFIGADFRGVSVRVERDAGRSAAVQAGPGGGADGVECALPAGADGHDRRLHRAQVGTAQGGVHAAGAGGDSEGDAGGDRLPGAGDADCQRAGELLAGRGGPAAAGDGQEESPRRWPSSGTAL